jgi:hypothetical protein
MLFYGLNYHLQLLFFQAFKTSLEEETSGHLILFSNMMLSPVDTQSDDYICTANPAAEASETGHPVCYCNSSGGACTNPNWHPHVVSKETADHAMAHNYF